jgi:predicted nucleic acid-binding protein
VTISEALRGVTRLFLDTAPVIYFVERNSQYAPRVDAIFDRIDDGTLPTATSPITLAECLVMPIRQGDTQAQHDFRDLIVSGANVSFVALEDAIAVSAADLRACYNLGLADALQVAAALSAGCDALVTNDAALRRVQELRMVILDDLDP